MTEYLQHLLDRLAATSRQRRMFGSGVVVAAVTGSLATTVPAERGAMFLTVLIAFWAVVAAFLPDSLAGLVVIAGIALQWIVTVDDPTTPWSLVIALDILVVHGLLAVMAVTPSTATIHPRAMLATMRGVPVAVLAAVGVWTLATVLEGRDANGNPGLLLAALVVIAVGAIVVRARSFR